MADGNTDGEKRSVTLSLKSFFAVSWLLNSINERFLTVLGMQLAAKQVVTERPDGRMGFRDAVKRHARQASREFSVEGVTGMIVEIQTNGLSHI